MKGNKITSFQLKRLMVIALFVFGCFTGLLIQYFRIQIIEEDFWQDRANRQHYFIVTEPFLRGAFYSNTSLQKTHIQEEQPLVFDIKKYHIYIDPLSIAENFRNEIAKNLFSLLNISNVKKNDFFEHFTKKNRSRKLASWLETQEKDHILEWWRPYAKKNKIPINALYFVEDFQRSYPFGKLLGQTLHTIQENKNEVTKQAVPTGGLEYQFHSFLKGKLGKRKMMRSPRHFFDLGEVIEFPENGCDIYLTINHVLQAICEEELEKGVNHSQGKSGWAVMIDPATGDVLALAQYPFFYPPNYQKHFNDKSLIEHVQVRAATDAYEPASVMKSITAAIALLANEELVSRGEKPLFDPEEMMPTANGIFPGRSAPIKDTKPAKFLDLNMAMQRSSNIYVARLMQQVVTRLGNDWYRNALLTFGFGKKTGIELPSESSGVLPKPKRKYGNGRLEWSTPTPFSLAMGHNLQANTFQVICAFSTFANGGYLVKPNLIRKIVKSLPNGEKQILIDRTIPQLREPLEKILPENIVNRVVKAMKYVTKPGGGVWGYTEVVKSGTAKKIVNGKYSSEKYCSSFIGFTPAKNPVFTLMVVVDEPNASSHNGINGGYYGSVCAGPIFKRIAERSLEYLGIPLDDPYGFSLNDPRTDFQKADWMIQSRLLQEKYEKWNK